MRFNLKTAFFFLGLFGLLFLEDRVKLGGSLTLSNVWKMLALFGFMLYSIDKILKKNGVDRFFIVISFLSLSLLINTNAIFAFDDIEEVVIVLILPVSYYSFYYFHKNNYLKIAEYLLYLSCFLIATSIPFILGLIDQLKENNVEADLYGLDKDILVGFFKHPAISSKIFVCATLYVYLYGINTRQVQWHKTLLWIFIAIGTYAVYSSFTRTGWFMLLLGFVFSLVYKKKTKDYIFKVVPLVFVLTFALLYVYNSNESIQRRLSADRIGRENSQIDETTSLTSGRDILISNGIESVFQEGTLAVFLGIGTELAIEKNDGSVAHNRFAEIFQYGGILSLFLFLWYIKLIYQQFSQRKTSTYIYSVNVLLFLLMIMSFIPSHGLPIWGDLIFGGALASNRIIYEQQSKLLTPKNTNNA